VDRAKHNTTTECWLGKVEQLYIKSKCGEAMVVLCLALSHLLLIYTCSTFPSQHAMVVLCLALSTFTFNIEQVYIKSKCGESQA
jgi:hypothetical protein